MKLNISIGREDDGDMIGSLAVNIGAENNSIHKVYVRDLKQAINEIKNFIALDSPNKAIKFRDELYEKIYGLDFMPKRCRKSTLANDESIRDLIFKGYIIVFKIQNDTIKVLYIYKENEPKMIF